MMSYKIKLLDWEVVGRKQSLKAFSITRISYTIDPLIDGSVVLSASQQTPGRWIEVLRDYEYRTVDEAKAAAQDYHIEQMEKGLSQDP